MHQRPKPGREEGSAVEQLLTSIGVRRRTDPFAHLAGDGEGGDGWLRARIDECVSRGVCPICDARRSGLSDFLFWLPANLRDADYSLSLLACGGFCPEHLDTVMTHLRGFPYSQVRLFTMVRMLLEEGRFAMGRSCHLCRTLEDSRQAYEQALRDRFAAAKEEGSPAACLCPRHARTFGRALAMNGSEHVGEQVMFPGLGKRRRASLTRALDEIAAGFHNMEMSELKGRLGACESLLREAMTPDAQGPPRRDRGGHRPQGGGNGS